MLLNKWKVVVGIDLPVSPEVAVDPERGACLHGIFSGHSQAKDGTANNTSPIVRLVDGKVQTESGQLVELGEIDPAYEAEFPDARARLEHTLTAKNEITGGRPSLAPPLVQRGVVLGPLLKPPCS